MRYKSDYPESYREGTVNKTFSISKTGFDLLNENMENQSAFVNDLIIEALQEKDFYKRRWAKELAKLQVEGKKYNMEVEIKGGA